MIVRITSTILCFQNTPPSYPASYLALPPMAGSVPVAAQQALSSFVPTSCCLVTICCILHIGSLHRPIVVVSSPKHNACPTSSFSSQCDLCTVGWWVCLACLVYDGRTLEAQGPNPAAYAITSRQVNAWQGRRCIQSEARSIGPCLIKCIQWRLLCA